MKTLRAVASLVIGLSGVLTMAWAVNSLLDTGTCVSGGPYVSANECPSGTAAVGYLLVGGVVAWFVGMFLSNNGFMRPGTGQIIWCALFLGGGIAALVKVLTEPALGDDAKLGGGIMASTSIVVGLPVAIGPFVTAWRERRRRS